MNVELHTLYSLFTSTTQENGVLRLDPKFRSIFEARWIVQRCIQKFLDWLLGVGTANGTALCH